MKGELALKKEKFNIEGMTCSSCSSHIERVVSKLEGTIEVNVNLLSNSMVVEYDEKVLDSKKIINTVVDAGYGASVDKKSNEIEEKTTNKSVEKMTKKEKAQIMQSIEEQMKEAAKTLDFERAMELRDILFELKSE